MKDILRELRRRNVVQTASIYLVSAWLVLQIVDTVSPYLHLPTAFGTAVTAVLIVGFPIAVVLSWIFELTPEGVKRSDEVDPDASITTRTGRQLNLVLLMLLACALGYIVYDLWGDRVRATAAAAATQSTAAGGAQAGTSQRPLAVLPFANLSSDAEQEYFVDGLTEEILNALARIRGLLVVGRTSSFAYKNRNMDLRRIADELGVDYLLEGSVRKSGERIRVTAQLIDAASGTHLLSETFDRRLVDVFALQREVAEQVAAALKLSILEDGGRYRSALEALDYVEVEQLVSARARLADWDALEIRDALATLRALEREHPQSPEVVGLLAYAHMMLFSTTDTGEEDFTAKAIALAERALALDPTNFDALTTLAALYDDFAETRRKAYDINQAMLRHHPGNTEAWSEMLGFLTDARYPCTDLRALLDQMPRGILPADAAWAARQVVDACFAPPLRDVPDPPRQAALDDMVLYFDLPRDRIYPAVTAAAEETASQRHLMVRYMALLRMGAEPQARRAVRRLDTAEAGFISWYTTLFGYAYGQRTQQTPADLLPFTRAEIRNAPDPVFVAPLILQAQAEDRPELLVDYLAGVPAFPVEVMNRNETLGLLLLQHYAGHRDAAHAVATQLLDELDRYYDEHPRAFRFWGLGTFAVAAACHAGRPERAQAVLDAGFAPDHALWVQDAVAFGLALAPCRGQPAADGLLAAFERDRARARARFGLD